MTLKRDCVDVAEQEFRELLAKDKRGKDGICASVMAALDEIADGDAPKGCRGTEVVPGIWLYTWRVNGKNVMACYGLKAQTLYLLLVQPFRTDADVPSIVDEARSRLMKIQ